MSSIHYWAMIAICVSIMGGVLFMMPHHGTVVYDCRMAEISPDFPNEVKEQCRKLRSGWV